MMSVLVRRALMNTWFILLCCGWLTLCLAYQARIAGGQSARTPLVVMDRPLLFTYGTWKDRVRVENGVALLTAEGMTPKGGVNQPLDLHSDAESSPGISVQVGARNTLKSLRLMLNDTLGHSGIWTFALPGPASGYVVYTSGVGANPIQHPLILDALATGQKPPIGITPYGIVDFTRWKDNWIVWPLTYYLGKDTQPSPFDWPTTESFFDVRMMPALDEFTMDQTMGPNAYVWGYLAARPAGEHLAARRRIRPASTIRPMRSFCPVFSRISDRHTEE